MTLGSLFDGSGTAPLCATLLGLEPLWASEIEPYPIAVTTARFPKMYHLGSITEINGAEVAPVDVIVGGSPCQDLSVAGKQAGLTEGTRSNLFYEMTRIIREMRGATNGQYPSYVVWENVPGAFSSNKGKDFLAVIEAFCAIADDSVHIPRPAEEERTGRLTWENAGSVVGDGWSFAWRVLDAQYWGVPQRRRRIFAVLDLGSERAGEILFERAGLSRNLEPRGEAGEGAAADAVGCADRGGGVRCLTPWDCQAQRIYDANGIFQVLAASSGGGQNRQAVIYPVGAVGSLCARADSSPCIDRGQPFVAYESGQGYWMPGFGCLRAEGENRPSRPSHCVYALQGNGIDRALTAGCNGAGWREGEMYTLNTIDRPAVAYGVDCRNGALNADLSPTMQAKNDGGHSLNYMPPVLYKNREPKRRYIVRRLTPTECARLQGFPDLWTDGVPGSDSAKYKMWGNGMALPCMLAVLNGVCESEKANRRTCPTCRHHLGGGQCRQNLEKDCAEGEFEAWQAKSN